MRRHWRVCRMQQEPWTMRKYDLVLAFPLIETILKEHPWIRNTSLIRTDMSVSQLHTVHNFFSWNKDTSLIYTFWSKECLQSKTALLQTTEMKTPLCLGHCTPSHCRLTPEMRTYLKSGHISVSWIGGFNCIYIYMPVTYITELQYGCLQNLSWI